MQVPFARVPQFVSDDPTLSPTDKAVYSVLIGRTDTDGTGARPSREFIAQRVGRCVWTVSQSLRRLRERGLIVVDRYGKGGRPTCYRVRHVNAERGNRVARPTATVWSAQRNLEDRPRTTTSRTRKKGKRGRRRVTTHTPQPRDLSARSSEQLESW